MPCASTVTFGSAQLDANGHIVFGVGAAGSDVVNVTNAGGLDARGVTIDIKALDGFGPGTYRLIDYAGAPKAADLKLGEVPAGFVCTLIDDSTVGAIQLRVERAK